MRNTVVRCSVALCLVLSAFVLAGCQSAAERSERPSDDWSRGVALGVAAINGRVGLATDDLGGSIYLAWVAEHEEPPAELLHFARLDRAGRVLEERDLSIGVDRPTQVEIVADRHGGLHLTWVDCLVGVRRLFHARLDKLGRLASYPRPISPPQAMVTSYAVGLDADGGLDLFWGAKEGEQAGLYHLKLDREGETVADNLHLGVAGFHPAFRTDRQGLVHLVWLDEPGFGEGRLRYATFDGQGRVLSRPAEITSFPVPTGLVAHRPSLGLAGDDVYIFWSLERRGGGLSRPSAQSSYVAFPLGRPDMAGEPRRVHIPPLNHPEYQPAQTQFAVRHLASAAQGRVSSDFIYTPWTSQGHREDLLTVFAVQLEGRTKSIVQVVLAVWREGELQGYQVAGQTRSLSSRPMLVADAGSDIHLAWIDTAGFGEFTVFYASTSSEARASLNRVTGQDIVAALFGFAWGVVQALSLFPIALVWFIPPCILLAIYVFVRAEGDLARPGSRVMLVVAVLAYTGFKYLFRPNWLAAIPLPRRLPSIIISVATYGAPLVISAAAGVVAWLYVRRREYSTLLAAFAVFAGSDALLTLLVYAPGILAE